MKQYKKYKRITVKADELLIIDCEDDFIIYATTENFDRIIDKKQIKIDCKKIAEALHDNY